MADLPVNNVGRIGLYTDRKAHEIPVEAWSRADNILFEPDGAGKITGHVAAAGTPLHAPRWIFPWRDSAGFKWLYVGTARIGQIVGTAHSDVTRFTTTLGDDDYLTGATTRFSGTVLGDLPVWTYSGEVDPPQAWNTATGRFYDLPNWQANTYADLICVTDRHLVAMRIKKAGLSFNPRMVKWGQPADPGTYPNSWDETDPTTGAGEVTLAETEGEIKGTRLLVNTRLIYKSDSVISMRFVGGQNIFAFDTIFDKFGALGPDAIGAFERSHIVVSEGDVILHNGNTFESVIDDRNKALLFKDLSAPNKDRTRVSVRAESNQVWISYVSKSSAGDLDKALIWDYKKNTWSFRFLQEFAHIATGFVDVSGVSRVYDQAPQTTRIYDTASEQYDLAQSATFNDLLAADFTNTLLYKLDETNQFNGVNMLSRLERQGLAIAGQDRFGEWKIDLTSQKFIRRVHFNMEASGPVTIYIGGQDKPNGPVSWVGPFAFDPTLDQWVEPLLNTRFFAIRIESNSDISWKLYSYTVELEVLGRAVYLG